MGGKIFHFTNLLAWREGHSAVLTVYMLVKQFPQEEKFALSSQLRRSVVSVTSNIAEGFARFSSKDKKYFYNMSLSSLYEVQNQLLIAKDLKYVEEKAFQQIFGKLTFTSKLINGLIKSANSK